MGYGLWVVGPRGGGSARTAHSSRPIAHCLFLGASTWSIPSALADRFPPTGTQLERYAGVFSAVEINSSFYREHRPATYARWATSVPSGFRFSVKLPRLITHERRLADPVEALEPFLAGVGLLGSKLGPILVQLPPSLGYEPGLAQSFFRELRDRHQGPVVCEPRHPTWFGPEPEALLTGWRVARVAADPAVVPAAGEPGGWRGLVYHRLHGSPEVYRSAYSSERLAALADRLGATGAERWCIFDNTALGAAMGDALGMTEAMGPRAMGY